ncbi:hypothetical protein [Actinoalloteichus hymeniacidonis]|uniref:DUF2613 family protein n=1 Tax=Actinoalloteichus hymeniacidonis TaxID=340345 RepID=A0AAC9HMN9_9PSEU|nr:hypothetical protein [Actinoalloteichus hymeniacidonis]AOS62134.1 hypothetical protein TL08_06550 [Actinoalloteichus hymeniacidonis]MBB5909844.1 hypothetical protein [Actinoalloteichus hymeniacidonis]
MGLRFFVISAVAMIASAIVGILLGAVLSTLHADVQTTNRSLDSIPGWSATESVGPPHHEAPVRAG